MKKKILKILGVILLIAFILGVALVAWTIYKIETGQLVKWEGKWYTQEELEEKYPPQEYEVEAKNTPEEVYQKFRQALLNNNKEKALGYIAEDSREEYREVFNNKELIEKYKKLPEVNDINKREKDSYKNTAKYYYHLPQEDNNKIPYDISFIKTKEGYWKIESI